jgi:hypothetical protein
MPPNGQEQNAVQFIILEKELSEQLAQARLLVQKLEEQAVSDGRTLGDEERKMAQQILNAPANQLIPIESPKLRFFLNHIPQEDWDRFRALAKDSEGGNVDQAEVGYFTGLYHEFCAQYDKWIREWMEELDPDTITALNDALENKEDPSAIETIQRITESLILRLEQQIDRTEE